MRSRTSYELTASLLPLIELGLKDHWKAARQAIDNDIDFGLYLEFLGQNTLMQAIDRNDKSWPKTEWLCGLVYTVRNIRYHTVEAHTTRRGL